MVNPYDKAHELVRAIMNNDTYKQYIAAKEKIEKLPDYKEMILKLRNKQMEVNRAQILGEELPWETINEMTVEFAKLNQKQEIAEFFEAEVRFVQLYNDIQEIIHKALQMELQG